MIVIIEGPRGCGKSTISIRVVKALCGLGIKAEYVKVDRGEDPTADMFDMILPMSREEDTAFVIDRFHVTELVHRMHDGTIPQDRLVREMSLVASCLAELDALVFYVSTTSKVRDQRLAVRNDGRPLDIPHEDAENLWSYAQENYFITDTVSNNEEDPSAAVRSIVLKVIAKGTKL